MYYLFIQRDIGVLFWVTTVILAYYTLPGIYEYTYFEETKTRLTGRLIESQLDAVSAIITAYSICFVVTSIILYYSIKKLTIVSSERAISLESLKASNFYVTLTIIGLITYCYAIIQKVDNGFIHYGGAINVVEMSNNQLNVILTRLMQVAEVFIPLSIIILFQNTLKRFQKTILILLLIPTVGWMSFGGATLITFVFFIIAHKIYAHKMKRVSIIKYFFIICSIVLVAFFMKAISRAIIFDKKITLVDTLYQTLHGIFNSLHGYQSIGLIFSDGSKAICSYCSFFENFLPRILFPNKIDDPTLGLWFTNTYWFPDFEIFVPQGTAITFLGEAYMNLELVGIMHAFIFGVIMTFIHFTYKKLSSNFYGHWFVTYIFFDTVHYIFSFGSWVGLMAKDLLIFCTVLFLSESFRLILRKTTR